MIIWSGLGILVGLVGILGLVVGHLLCLALGLPELGMGLGLGCAALANYLLWKSITPKRPRVLIDPATGEQVVMKRCHSLFFIPATAWTWIFLVLAVPAIGLGIAEERAAAVDAKIPGHAGFVTADEMLDSPRNGVSHGNETDSDKAAGNFSRLMKSFCEKAFTGGEKHGLLVGADYPTYCQVTPRMVLFLCQVPELRKYRTDDAKNGLAEIAWKIANSECESLDPEKKKQLLVGLRNVTSYDILLQGQVGGPVPTREDGGMKPKVFYPAFVPAGP